MSAGQASPAASGSRVVRDPVRALQHALYRAAKADPGRRFHALYDKVRPGSALAARYSACCKARTGSAGMPRPDPFAAGLATWALTGPLLTDMRTDEAAALPSPQVVLSCGSTGTTAASDAHPASHPLPGITGYRTPRSGDTSAGHRAGEGLPSSRRHHRCVPRPIRRGVPHGCASRLFTASLAFAPISRGSALPCPPRRTAE